MTTQETLPRRFGAYVLTFRLGEDALGTVFRALRASGERAFARLRMIETEELAEDAVLDAIEEFGEIHSFLKNPAITRGVAMDSVEGIPFIAWNEDSGRTLDVLLARTRSIKKRVPIEHALLIAEKVATALDHAYNTTVDGERTLHGLVWPGFVAISDDGETRLTGFGLAPGVLPSLSRPRLAAEIAPYLAPEERTSAQVGRNADVYSVGAILFELLTGRLPSPADPLGDLRSATRDPAAPLAPELAAILRMCLAPAETRYQSSGELRRELGKLLFSGPYAPSTFNLAFYLSGLFGVEIEAENQGRAGESSLDPGSILELELPPSRHTPGGSTVPRPVPAGRTETPRPARGRGAAADADRRNSLPAVIALLLVLAVGGGIWAVIRRPHPAQSLPPAKPSPTAPHPTPTAEPTPASTNKMTEAQFQAEVARRLAQELKRLAQVSKTRPARAQTDENATSAAAALAAAARPETTPASPPPGSPAETRTPASGSAAGRDTPPAEPTEAPARSLPSDGVETAPKIQSLVEPVYPPFALRARIHGVVILRVLVGENGTPLDIEVVQGGGGGLTEAAVAAVRRWKFEPARKNGTPVRAWTTVPIPFEP